MTAKHQGDDSEGSLEDLVAENRQAEPGKPASGSKEELLKRKERIESKIQLYYDRGNDKKIAELEKERTFVIDSIERLDLDGKIKTTQQEMDQIEGEKAKSWKQQRKLRAKLERYTNDKKDEKKLAKLEKERKALEANIERLEMESKVKERMARYHQKLREKNIAKMKQESLNLQNSLTDCLNLETSAQQLNTANELLNASANLLGASMEDEDFGDCSELTGKDDETFASTIGAIKSQKAMDEKKEREHILAMKKKKLEKQKKRKKKADKKKKTGVKAEDVKLDVKAENSAKGPGLPLAEEATKLTDSVGELVDAVADDKDEGKFKEMEGYGKATVSATEGDAAEEDLSQQSNEKAEKTENVVSPPEETMHLGQDGNETINKDNEEAAETEAAAAVEGDAHPGEKTIDDIDEEKERASEDMLGTTVPSSDKNDSFVFGDLDGSRSSTAEESSSESSMKVTALTTAALNPTPAAEQTTKNENYPLSSRRVSVSSRVKEIAAQFEATSNRSFNQSFGQSFSSVNA